MVRLGSPVMSLAAADKLFATANNRYESNAASDEVVALLREVAALDESHLASTAAADGARRRIALDCLQPEFDDDGVSVFNDELLAMPTKPGRRCADGECSSECARIFRRDFATPDECAQLVRHATALMPSATSKLQHDLTLEDTGAAVTARVDGAPSAHLLLVRLVERMRRLVAAEFDVPLITLKPRLAFVNRIVAPDSLSEFDVGELHADECSNAAYHYSSIIYLNQGDEGQQYTGGDLCFVDPGGNRLLRPEVGLGALFSSGWENVHHVTPVLSGTRFCMPLFFTSQPPPESVADTSRRKLPKAAAPSTREELARCALRPKDWKEHESALWHWPGLFGVG